MYSLFDEVLFHVADWLSPTAGFLLGFFVLASTVGALPAGGLKGLVDLVVHFFPTLDGLEARWRYLEVVFAPAALVYGNGGLDLSDGRHVFA
jgi:hypothetical protein